MREHTVLRHFRRPRENHIAARLCELLRLAAIGKARQQIADQREPRAPLMIGAHHMPGRLRMAGTAEHVVARLGGRRSGARFLSTDEGTNQADLFLKATNRLLELLLNALLIIDGDGNLLLGFGEFGTRAGQNVGTNGS